MDILTIYDYIGFVGVAILIYSFTRLNLIHSFGSTAWFYACNGAGSFLLLFSDVYRGSWFSVGIGIFWVLISVLTILNKLKLPNTALVALCALAIAYFGAGIGYELLHVKSGLDSGLNALGMVATAICVVIYGNFAANRIGLSKYLMIGVFAKLLMMIALMNNFNMASFSLQAYSVVMAFIGLSKLHAERKSLLLGQRS
jgi:hypothetical protein